MKSRRVYLAMLLLALPLAVFDCDGQNAQAHHDPIHGACLEKLANIESIKAGGQESALYLKWLRLPGPLSLTAGLFELLNIVVELVHGFDSQQQLDSSDQTHRVVKLVDQRTWPVVRTNQ